MNRTQKQFSVSARSDNSKLGSVNNTHSHTTNSFDFLRITAALAVLFSHSFPIIGLPEPQPIAGQTFGSLAVALFFAVSGFLVCQSWSRDPSLTRFGSRRALRIMPGLCVVVLLTALVIGPLFSTLPVRGYFANPKWWQYIPCNLLFISVPALPGLFETNPLPFGSNGSLWTLRYEVLMYAWLAFIGSLLPRAKLKHACVASFLGFAILWCVLTIGHYAPYQLPFVGRIHMELYGDQVGSLGAFFFAGSCMLLYLQRIRLSLLIAALLLSLCVIMPYKNVAMPMLWIAIPYATISFAYRGPVMFRKLTGFDYSYGIYIYAFPVQQIVAQWIPDVSHKWFASFAIATGITVALAAMSWYLIEKPALALKPRLSPSEARASVVA